MDKRQNHKMNFTRYPDVIGLPACPASLPACPASGAGFYLEAGNG